MAISHADESLVRRSNERLRRMTSRSTMLRDAYVEGFEIVTIEGRHPVIHMPRSHKDKLPWVREVEGIPFRYHAGELTDVHTRATIAHAARVATGRPAVTYLSNAEMDMRSASEPSKRTELRPRRESYMTRDTMEGILTSSRAKGELDPYWWRMS